MGCDNVIRECFESILAHPWPSVRKLDVYGEFIFEDIVPRLAAVSNVEELTMDNIAGDYSGWNVVNLCEIDRVLPKLVRMTIAGDRVILTSQLQPQQLFRHLRYASFERVRMTPSAFSALVHAPLLIDICLNFVSFRNDDDIDISDEDEDDRRRDPALNLEFFVGVTNTAVRSVDIDFSKYTSPVNYEDIIRAMLKCFVRLGICIIRTEYIKTLRDLRNEFPVVKIKRLE
ncbi:hypothetical protein GQ42DRAFT_46348 [Ramicandelaber brevisporus]|nr:hypothetical protein GQ42DRAFT_46348 [Ramicandelaber brevisporus]